MMRQMTQEYLREIMNYDPATGLFSWKAAKANAITPGDTAGWPGNRGYLSVKIDNKNWRLARLAVLYMEGRLPRRDEHVDHIDQNVQNNRWENLRVVSCAENQKNKPMQRNNKSGHSGVYWCNTFNRWVAQGYLAGRKVSLGSFVHIADAVEVRRRWEQEHNYHANHGSRKALATTEPEDGR